MTELDLHVRPSDPGRLAEGAVRVVRGTADGSLYVSSWLDGLADEGRIYDAADADENDTVTGQTSFVATTPTFLLRVPDKTTAIPLCLKLVQAGSVAGDFIQIHVSTDNADRYSSGGTSEAVLSSRTDNPHTNACTFYTGATASAGYGITIDHETLAEDIDPASADAAPAFSYLWLPRVPRRLVGPAAFLVYTYATSTAPTWRWAFSWAEIPSSAIGG